MMRLRLRVERNELPAVNTLWPLSESDRKLTMAQLLEQVSAVFPLESETWGLEHYAVTVGGYECLHYQVVGDVCKDEDEVLIRPLQTAEVRARRLLGRDQISPDGRHLLDGIPFGKPKLRGVTRPDVRIPPRKKRKLDDAGEEAVLEAEEGAAAGALMQVDMEDADEEDDEDDVDFADYLGEGDAEGLSSDDSEDDESTDDDDRSSSDDDSDESSDLSSDDSSDSDDSDEDNLTDESWEGIDAPSTSPSKEAARATELGKRITDTQTAQTNGKADKTGLAHDSQPSHEHSTAPQAQSAPAPPCKYVGQPHAGKETTRTRNARKRDQRALLYLKKMRVLPEGATLADYRNYKDGVNGSPAARHTGQDEEAEEEEEKETVPDAMEHKRQELLRAIRSGGVDVTPKPKFGTKRRSSQVDGAANDEGPEELSAKVPAPEVEVNGEEATEDSTMSHTKRAPTKITDMTPSSVLRRHRMDASAQRMVFSSLGLRAPKSEEERAAAQKRLEDRNKQRMSAPGKAATTQKQSEAPQNQPVAAEEQAEEDDESWRDKIELSAVECVEVGVEYSTPPFPFYQRWDPAQRRKKSKGRTSQQYSGSNKRLKRGANDSVAQGVLVETYDKYGINDQGDALDYDEAEEEDYDDSYWEEGALMDDEYDEEGSAAAQLQNETAEAADDGFPPLPDDVSTLPALEEASAKKGDFIVYNELVCSAATNWQPDNLTRTAQLISKDEDGWTIKMALRDLPPKEFDENGQRVYSKFEMGGLTDDEEDDEREKVVKWAELDQPRLLLRREEAAVTEGAEEHAVNGAVNGAANGTDTGMA
jgi:hypothetical protein